MRLTLNSIISIRHFSVQQTSTSFHHSAFVPKHAPAVNEDIRMLKQFIKNSHRLVVITCAGISTESGIPDYRSEGVGLYARSNHRPIQFLDYLKSAEIRQRYWARNYIGWPKFSQSEPNVTHYAIQSLENMGTVSCIITQNVDGLHLKAGSKNVIELHGTAFRVICLSCSTTYNRDVIQEKLLKLNPDLQQTFQMVRPDGDVEIEQDKITNFRPPFCEHCGGVLKPDITFFGDNVPKSRIDAVKKCVSESDSVLVLGSSLTVFSGYRIILQAADENKTIAIVNIGATRGDKHAHLKISARCGDILPKIF